MIDRALLFGLGSSLITLVVVLELVRQRRLKEEYSLLWLATALALFGLSLSRPTLDVLASAVGIVYPPSALFVVAVIFVLFILLQFSTVLTRLSRENKEMAQQMAIMQWELAQLQRSAVAAPDEAGMGSQPGDKEDDK